MKADSRIKLVNELVEGIQLIKMYGWDEEFAKMIIKKREEEQKYIRNIYNLTKISRGFFEASNVISLILIIFPYIYF